MRNPFDRPISDTPFQDALPRCLARQHRRSPCDFNGNASRTFCAPVANRLSAGTFLLCSKILLKTSLPPDPPPFRFRAGIRHGRPLRSLHPSFRRLPVDFIPPLFQEPHRKAHFINEPAAIRRHFHLRQFSFGKLSDLEANHHRCRPRGLPPNHHPLREPPSHRRRRHQATRFREGHHRSLPASYRRFAPGRPHHHAPGPGSFRRSTFAHQDFSRKRALDYRLCKNRTQERMATGHHRSLSAKHSHTRH